MKKRDLLISLFLLGISAASYCASIDEKSVLGMSRAELVARYPESSIPSASFSILISKKLHHLNIPKEHLLLRYGNSYTVFELKDDVVIAIHKISG